MTLDQWIVTIVGLALVAFIVWFFWLKRATGVRAAEASGGYQEAMILVKGGYTPDTIIVRHGKPVRLNFRREETSSCSEKVILADFAKNADLPAGETGAGGVPARAARRVRVRVSHGHVPRPADRGIAGPTPSDANGVKSMRAIAKASVLLGLVLSCAATAAEDGVLYVPEGSANQILVLDEASGEVVRRIEGVPEVHGLSATPDGRFLVAGSFAESAPGEAPPKPEGVSADEHAAHHDGGASAQEAPQTVSYVSIIRPDDGTITRRIAVPGAVHHIAVSPNGRCAVATHPSGDGISLIDLEAFEVTTVATGPLPNYAVISGDSAKIYVSNAGNDTVSEVDAGRGIVLRNVVVGASPEHLVLAPDGERLYVANVDDGTVSAIALPRGEVVQTFEIGGLLHGLDLSSDGKTLFVSAREANEVVTVDLPTGTMKRHPLGPQPYHLTAGDGGRIYVTSAAEAKLWVLDAGSLEVVREVPLQDIGHQVVVAPEPAA